MAALRSAAALLGSLLLPGPAGGLDVKRRAASLTAGGREVCGAPGLEAWRAALAGLAPHAPGTEVPQAYKPRGHDTLLVESDVSAWNNVRMSWETAVCLAYKTRRWYRVPHIPTDGYADVRLKFEEGGHTRRLNMFDYYDEDSFRRVVPALLDSEPLPPGSVFFATADPFVQHIDQLTDPQHTHIVYQGGPGHEHTRVFAQYAAVNEFAPHNEYVHLIESAFRLREDLICRTIRRLAQHGLEPGGYVALHRRRGDTIGMEEYEVGATRTARHVAPLLRNRTVLVITDTYEPAFLEKLRNISGAARVVCWAGEVRTGDELVFAAQVDMLAAVGATEFIGTPHSTFSTGIIRWRKQAGTHKVGSPVHFTHTFQPGYSGWPSPGARGTWVAMGVAADEVPRPEPL